MNIGNPCVKVFKEYHKLPENKEQRSLLQTIVYEHGTATIKVHTETDKIPIKRVEQSETISSKLFRACLGETQGG